MGKLFTVIEDYREWKDTHKTNYKLESWKLHLLNIEEQINRYLHYIFYLSFSSLTISNFKVYFWQGQLTVNFKEAEGLTTDKNYILRLVNLLSVTDPQQNKLSTSRKEQDSGRLWDAKQFSMHGHIPLTSFQSVAEGVWARIREKLE